MDHILKRSNTSSKKSIISSPIPSNAPTNPRKGSQATPMVATPRGKPSADPVPSTSYASPLNPSFTPIHDKSNSDQEEPSSGDSKMAVVISAYEPTADQQDVLRLEVGAIVHIIEEKGEMLICSYGGGIGSFPASAVRILQGEEEKEYMEAHADAPVPTDTQSTQKGPQKRNWFARYVLSSETTTATAASAQSPSASQPSLSSTKSPPLSRKPSASGPIDTIPVLSNKSILVALPNSTGTQSTPNLADSSSPATPSTASPSTSAMKRGGRLPGQRMLWVDYVGGPEAVAKLELSKQEIKRQEVIYEIITTEADYIQDLETVLELYIRPLQKSKLIRPKDMTVIFSNIEQFLPVNEELLRELELKQQANPVIDSVGSILIGMSDYLKMYTMYCGNHPYALERLQNVRQTRAIAKFLDEAAHKPQSRAMDLGSFLLKPIQRVCKYPLLVRDLIKSTSEEHPDYETLNKAMGKIETVVAFINEGARQAENVHKMLELQSKFSTKISLVAPSRFLVKSGQVKIFNVQHMLRPRELYLFNDLLLVAKQEGEKYKLLTNAEIDTIQLHKMKESSEGFTWHLEIYHVGHEKMVLEFDNENTRETWYTALKSTMTNFMEHKARIDQANTIPIKLVEDPHAPTVVVEELKSPKVYKNVLTGDSNGASSQEPAKRPPIDLKRELEKTLLSRKNSTNDGAHDRESVAGTPGLKKFTPSEKPSPLSPTATKPTEESQESTASVLKKVEKSQSFSKSPLSPDKPSSVKLTFQDNPQTRHILGRISDVSITSSRHSRSTSSPLGRAGPRTEDPIDDEDAVKSSENITSPTHSRGLTAPVFSSSGSSSSTLSKQLRTLSNSDPSKTASSDDSLERPIPLLTIGDSINTNNSSLDLKLPPFKPPKPSATIKKGSVSGSTDSLTNPSKSTTFGSSNRIDENAHNHIAPAVAASVVVAAPVLPVKSSISVSIDSEKKVPVLSPKIVSEKDAPVLNTLSPATVSPVKKSPVPPPKPSSVSSPTKPAVAAKPGALQSKPTISAKAPAPAIQAQISVFQNPPQTQSPPKQVLVARYNSQPLVNSASSNKESLSKLATEPGSKSNGSLVDIEAPATASSGPKIPSNESVRKVSKESIFKASIEDVHLRKVSSDLIKQPGTSLENLKGSEKMGSKSGLGKSVEFDEANLPSGKLLPIILANIGDSEIEQAQIKKTMTLLKRTQTEIGKPLTLNRPIKAATITDISKVAKGSLFLYYYNIGIAYATGDPGKMIKKYEDFVDLHMQLLGHFPEAAGIPPSSTKTLSSGNLQRDEKGSEKNLNDIPLSTKTSTGRLYREENVSARILPEIPPQVLNVTDAIAQSRAAQLQLYIDTLLTLPPKISRSQLIFKFFKGNQQ